MRARILVAAALACLTATAWETRASTGAFSGVLERVAPPRFKGPNDREKDTKLLSFVVRSKFVVYQSNTVHHTGELVDWYQLRSFSATSVAGQLTSVQAFRNALPHLAGNYIYVYEDKHFDVGLTPPFTFGLLRGVDLEAGTLAIDVWQTNRKYHYSENPVLRVTEKIAPDARFKTEPWQDLPRENVPGKLGRWVQVHPPRRQTIWVETGTGRWNPGHLPTAAGNAARGATNSLTHNAVLLCYVPMRFDVYGGRYFPGIEIETWQNTEREGKGFVGRFQSEPMVTELGGGHVRVVRGGRGTELGGGAILDQHPAPAWVAQRPGRRFAACHYRREAFPHERFFKTMDDEIVGTIAAIDAARVTIEVAEADGKSRQVAVEIDPKGRTFLDGKLVTGGAGYAKGQHIRVFPKREQQTVVFLDGWRPYAPAHVTDKAIVEKGLSVTFAERSRVILA